MKSSGAAQNIAGPITIEVMTSVGPSRCSWARMVPLSGRAGESSMLVA